MSRHKTFGALSMSDAELMTAALVGFEHQRDEIEEKMVSLRQQLDARVGPAGKSAADSQVPTHKKRTMSAAGRRRIAAAQRKRWAESKKAQAEEAAPVPKRKMRAAARKRIGDATKKRWAEFRNKKAAAKKGTEA